MQLHQEHQTFPLRIFSLIGPLTLALLVPASVYAQDYGWLANIIEQLRGSIAITVPVLLGVAVLFFIWGLLSFFLNADNENAREAGRRRMVWGVIALFVIVTVWGIVALLTELSGVTTGQGYDAPAVDTMGVF